MEPTLELRSSDIGTSLTGFLTVALISLVAVAGCSWQEAKTPDAQMKNMNYPAATRGDQLDDYHGASVADPYRWMEARDSEEIRKWVGEQNALAQPYLESIARHEGIKNRLTELWNYERFTVPVKKSGRYFFERNDGLQDQSVLYVSEGSEQTSRVLIDPNTFSRDATISLSQFIPSPDASMLAYSVSDGGTDWDIWRVRDVNTGEDLKDELRNTKFTSVSWNRDNQGFYYSRYPTGPDGKGDDSKQVSIHFHRLGNPQKDDQQVFSITDHPTRNPYPELTEDGRYLLIRVSDGFNTNGIYFQDLKQSTTRVVRLFDAWDALYTFLGNRGSLLFFHTTRDAPNGRVIAVNADAAPGGALEEIVPEAEQVLEMATLVGGRIIAQYLEHAQSVVKVFGIEGTLESSVALPGVGTAGGFAGRLEDSETFYSYTDFTTPITIYRYDVQTGQSSLFKQASVSLDTSVYVTKQVFFESVDGTRIPMFLVHHKNADLDGQNPTLLYGYGGFNIALTPQYRTDQMVWLELGGVLAIPNLRGGSEYGEAWHLAGTKLQKQNVFDDFIAAAEWLIQEGYTSSEKLAIQGRSNGGLLVGAAMTQRPELFGAALPAVGVLDMLRYHTASANARQWSSDYGLSEEVEEFKALYAYSPYHNVSQGTCYPPTLITTGDHDDRVVPWHSYKFGAALQAAQDCTNPIIVRIETRAGHGAGKPTWMRIEDVANHWAFLIRVLAVD